MREELQSCPQTATIEEVRNSLEQTQKGKVSNSAANYRRVLQYDPLLKGAIRKKSFDGAYRHCEAAWLVS